MKPSMSAYARETAEALHEFTWRHVAAMHGLEATDARRALSRAIDAGIIALVGHEYTSGRRCGVYALRMGEHTSDGRVQITVPKYPAFYSPYLAATYAPDQRAAWAQMQQEAR